MAPASERVGRWNRPERSQGTLSDVEDRLPIGLAELISRGQPTRQIRWNFCCGFLKRLLGVTHFVERKWIEETFRQSQEHDDLFDHRHRVRFGLFETRANAAAVVNCFLRRVVESSAKLCEGFQLLELRVSEPEAAGNCAICCSLRRSTDARN
jgi:hypothetical protein